MMVRLINILTISRIFLAIIIFILLSIGNNYFFALLLFVLAGISDYFDGYLARKYNATSQLGEILDPIADKILIIFLFFGIAINLSSYLVGFVGAFIITREIWVSALRDFNAQNGNMQATKVLYISKVKTSIQLFTIIIYLVALSFNKMLLIIIGDIFLIISLLITLYTGYIYTVSTFRK